MLPPIPFSEITIEYSKEAAQLLIPNDQIINYQLIKESANDIWKITTATEKEYIFRDLIHRSSNFSEELAISTFAASTDLSPKVIGSNIGTCQLLLEYIPLNPWPPFSENPMPYYEAMKLLRNFHDSGSLYFSNTKTNTSYNPFTFVLEEGEKLLKDEKLPYQFTIAFERIQKIFDHLKPWIETNAMLCHGDFHLGNVLLSKARVYLIDWENCSWGDPLFDIVKFSCRLKSEERMLLYKSYLQQEPTLSEKAHFELIDLALLMVVSVNRLKQLRNQKSLQRLTKKEAEERLEQGVFPSYLTIPYPGDSSLYELAFLSALSEFLKRTEGNQLDSLLKCFNQES